MPHGAHTAHQAPSKLCSLHAPPQHGASPAPFPAGLAGPFTPAALALQSARTVHPNQAPLRCSPRLLWLFLQACLAPRPAMAGQDLRMRLVCSARTSGTCRLHPLAPHLPLAAPLSSKNTSSSESPTCLWKPSLSSRPRPLRSEPPLL